MDAMERQLAGMTLYYGDDDEIAEGASSSRSWAEMSPDALTHIFRRLPLWQLLIIIPRVCKPWKRASLNPLCYQTLDLRNLHFVCEDDNDDKELFWVSSTGYPLTEVLLVRSQGCLLEISYGRPFMDDLPGLYLIARSAPLLQKLHIPRCLAADNEWASYAAPLMPQIVDLDVSMCANKLSHEAIEAFGKSCRHMRRLRRNRPPFRAQDGPSSCVDSEALAIAQYYPCLEHLELQCNYLSSKGLQAILDSCPLLEYLDVTGCEHLLLDMDSSLYDKCQVQLKVFINDYPFKDKSASNDGYDGRGWLAGGWS